jgi:hypothetical protein
LLAVHSFTTHLFILFPVRKFFSCLLSLIFHLLLAVFCLFFLTFAAEFVDMVRNSIIGILISSILLTGFSQVLDIVSFHFQGYYVSNDQLAFTNGNIIYCGSKDVLNKKLNDHQKSSNNSNDQAKREIQLYRQNDPVFLVFIPQATQYIWPPDHIGNIINCASGIFHPPC